MNGAFLSDAARSALMFVVMSETREPVNTRMPGYRELLDRRCMEIDEPPSMPTDPGPHFVKLTPSGCDAFTTLRDGR